MDSALDTPQAPPAVSYWKESRQPIYTAALVAPFVVAYEAGIILLRSEFINGGDAIVSTLFGRFFHLIGVKIAFVSLAILLGYLVVLQFKRKGEFRFEFPTLAGMFVESVFWAVLLFQILSFGVQYLPRSQSAPMRPVAMEAAVSAEAASRRVPETLARNGKAETVRKGPVLQDFILYCGAGVYEELVFRVFLLGLLMLVFTKLFHMEHAYAAVWAVILGAIVFSAFHHIGGEVFTWSRFLQRAFAGLYFAALYFTRSFGIAAASHALFDILVGLNQVL